MGAQGKGLLALGLPLGVGVSPAGTGSLGPANLQERRKPREPNASAHGSPAGGLQRPRQGQGRVETRGPELGERLGGRGGPRGVSGDVALRAKCCQGRVGRGPVCGGQQATWASPDSNSSSRGHETPTAEAGRAREGGGRGSRCSQRSLASEEKS